MGVVLSSDLEEHLTEAQVGVNLFLVARSGGGNKRRLVTKLRWEEAIDHMNMVLDLMRCLSVPSQTLHFFISQSLNVILDWMGRGQINPVLFCMIMDDPRVPS